MDDQYLQTVTMYALWVAAGMAMLACLMYVWKAWVPWEAEDGQAVHRVLSFLGLVVILGVTLAGSMWKLVRCGEENSYVNRKKKSFRS